MQQLPAAGSLSASGGSWIPKAASPADGPHMTRDFARVYELTGNRVTAPVATEALRRAGPVGAGTRLLDIGAGAGALSIPAAYSGASVLAIDIAPGMVELLTERLAPFPRAKTSVMDGEDLQLADGCFDLAFSIFGVSLFADWRKGLREQYRVLTPGGKASVATWKTPLGGGPFVVMANALRAVFPSQTAPLAPEGFVVLSDPERFATEMRAAGFSKVQVVEIDAVWQGPAGHAYLEELNELHRYMAPYAVLSAEDQHKVDDAIVQVIDKFTVDSQVRIVSPVLIAMGTKMGTTEG